MDPSYAFETNATTYAGRRSRTAEQSPSASRSETETASRSACRFPRAPCCTKTSRWRERPISPTSTPSWRASNFRTGTAAAAAETTRGRKAADRTMLPLRVSSDARGGNITHRRGPRDPRPHRRFRAPCRYTTPCAPREASCRARARLLLSREATRLRGRRSPRWHTMR